MRAGKHYHAIGYNALVYQLPSIISFVKGSGI